MIDAASPARAGDTVESVLRQELAHGDAMRGTIAPILRHLLSNDDHSVFGDEIIARVRGMTADMARQLLAETGLGPDLSDEDVARQIAELTGAMLEVPALVGHLHALALEAQLTERLLARHALDPVLSPLLQALIASTDASTASTAMKLLAAQARFCQSLRRMKHPLGELPGDLLHGCLMAMRAALGTEPEADERAAQAERAVRTRYDEAQTRLGLIARLVTGMGGGAIAALSITHAGAAIFLSALALASGQDRDLAVIATNESQLARLALSLRAAGLKPQAIEEQFLALHPEVALPEGFEQLGADQAAAILAASGGFAGY